MRVLFKLVVFFALFFILSSTLVSSMEINERPEGMYFLMHSKGANMDHIVNSSQLSLGKQDNYGGVDEVFVHFNVQHNQDKKVGFPYLLRIKDYNVGMPQTSIITNYDVDIYGEPWMSSRIVSMIFEEFFYEHKKYDTETGQVILQSVEARVEYGSCFYTDIDKMIVLRSKNIPFWVDDSYLEEIEIVPRNGAEEVESFSDIDTLIFKICPLLINGVDIRNNRTSVKDLFGSSKLQTE